MIDTLHFETIWYMRLSLSKELSLFFFFIFSRVKKTKALSYNWISVQNSP